MRKQTKIMIPIANNIGIEEMNEDSPEVRNTPASTITTNIAAHVLLNRTITRKRINPKIKAASMELIISAKLTANNPRTPENR